MEKTEFECQCQYCFTFIMVTSEHPNYPDGAFLCSDCEKEEDEIDEGQSSDDEDN